MKAGRIAWSIVGLLSFSGAAWAGAVLELVPSNPGPYLGGEALTVDFWLRSDVGHDADLRTVVLDFQDSDPNLSLDTEIAFDPVFFTTAPLGLHYTLYPDLPIVVANFGPAILLPPGSLVVLHAGAPRRIGSLGLQLPSVAGIYTLDALNADEENFLQGGALLGVDPGGVWRACIGGFSGGRLEFQVVPEPATVVLFVAGVVVLARKRVPSPTTSLP